MPIELYKIIHLTAALAVFAVLGGVIMSAANGVTKEGNSWRKRSAIVHGVGLTFILISGFGLLAKNGIGAPPPWALVKLALWLALGGLLPLAYRSSETRSKIWWALIAIGFVAAYIGVSWRSW